MKLPNRIIQHKAESDSYAILVYKLRSIGIFRNVTESDYGIDFEVEIVDGEDVTGYYYKAQVKSSEKLYIRKKDKIPVVSGIKESTLYYWTELSYKTHVIVYAVDLKTETIYFSRPIFWQATKLINGNDKSKSICFIKDEDVNIKAKDLFAVISSKIFALSPSVSDEIHNHKMALKHLKQFFELYVDVFHYDYHCEVHNIDGFKTLLDVCKVLLWYTNFDNIDLKGHDKKYLYSFEYWVKKSGDNVSDDEVTNYSAQFPVKTLLPLLIKELAHLRKQVFLGKYYWSIKNRTYLRLVYETTLPINTNHELLQEWGYNFDKYQGGLGFSCFLHYDMERMKKEELI